MRTIGFAFTAAALDALEGLPHKIRRQVIRKAKALHTTPFPPGCKKLRGVETGEGPAVYRERSGDYRILYAVRESPEEIIILDIDHRKDVYKMPKTDTSPTDAEMRMKEDDFDDMMRQALGAGAPPKDGSPVPSKPNVIDIEQAGKRSRRKRATNA